MTRKRRKLDASLYILLGLVVVGLLVAMRRDPHLPLAGVLASFRLLRGVWIENKKMSLSMHFRGASVANRSIAQLVARRALKAYHEHLQIEENLRDWEVLPRICGDKGIAVKSEIKRKGLHSALPIYIGDDISDEAAFRALKDGVTVHVGIAQGTCARYIAKSPVQVSQVLARIDEVLR